LKLIKGSDKKTLVSKNVDSNYSQGACLNEELSVKKEKEFISVVI